MKVVRLHAVNIKKIKEADIEPHGNLILISGKNGQGKSSLLDCLLYALAGKREIPGMPVRQGQESGKIELDLGELKVVRTFTDKETYLRVLTKEGAEYPDAQQRLSALVKSIYFDPMQFADMKAAEQRDTLLKLIGVNIIDEEASEAKARSERVIVGRMLKQAEGELAGVPEPTKADRQLKEVSVVELSTRQAELRSIIDTGLERDRAVKSIESDIEALEQQLAVKKASLKQAKEVAAEAGKKAKSAQLEYGKVEQTLLSADATNAKVRQVAQFYQVKRKVDELTAKYNGWSDKVDGAIKAKADKLAKAEMPVKGLSVDASGVTYNGIPFEQLSKSEQIKVSLGIAMAQDSGLKLIRIMDGSLLDSDNLTVIKEMATDRDYQVWVEIVDESGEVGYYIEDGEVKATN